MYIRISSTQHVRMCDAAVFSHIIHQCVRMYVCVMQLYLAWCKHTPSKYVRMYKHSIYKGKSVPSCLQACVTCIFHTIA